MKIAIEKRLLEILKDKRLNNAYKRLLVEDSQTMRE